MTKANVVGWFDIYVNDMNRAVAFYEAVLGQNLQQISDPTDETQMMAFDANMESYGASGALVKSPFVQPGPGGAMVYFSVDDCAGHEKLVEAAGGKLTRPKFSIGKFGWVSLCQDSEGNSFGLSSLK